MGFYGTTLLGFLQIVILGIRSRHRIHDFFVGDNQSSGAWNDSPWGIFGGNLKPKLGSFLANSALTAE